MSTATRWARYVQVPMTAGPVENTARVSVEGASGEPAAIIADLLAQLGGAR